MSECPQCKKTSGDDWSQCGDTCPMRGIYPSRWIVLVDFNRDGSSESWNTNYMQFYSAASEKEADFVGAYEVAHLINEEIDGGISTDDWFSYYDIGAYELREEGKEADS